MTSSFGSGGGGGAALSPNGTGSLLMKWAVRVHDAGDGANILGGNVKGAKA
ncbi:hypothetical protein [Nocardia sp. NPDC057030]|uniref:hypothetical protein n=1 Tax=unclassified Nocardia TaxID=2637762 RepID=UPI00362A8E00